MNSTREQIETALHWASVVQECLPSADEHVWRAMTTTLAAALRVAEAREKRLRETLEWIRDTHFSLDDKSETRKWIGDVLSETEDPKPKWISIDDKLPPDGDWVLVCDTDKWIEIGYFDGWSGGWYSASGGTELMSISHWVDLPDPPEDT